MQESAVVLGVLRERGRKGLPLTQLYRQMFNGICTCWPTGTSTPTRGR